MYCEKYCENVVQISLKNSLKIMAKPWVCAESPDYVFQGACWNQSDENEKIYRRCFEETFLRVEHY